MLAAYGNVLTALKSEIIAKIRQNSQFTLTISRELANEKFNNSGIASDVKRGDRANPRYYAAIKAGSSNTQLMRPSQEAFAKEVAQRLTGTDVEAQKLVDKYGFNPYEAGCDFARYLGRVRTLRDVKEVERMLFPKKGGGGIANTVGEMTNSFCLVPGIKQYEHARKDTSTGGVIAFKPDYSGLIDISPKMLLSLSQIIPLGLIEYSPDVPISWDVCVNLGGKYMETLNAVDQRRLMDYLECKGFNCTRYDLKVDIPYSQELWDFLEVCYWNETFTNFQTKDDRGGGRVGEEYSRTLYFGSPNSLCRLCVYRTKVKHGYDAIRLEGRWLREKANRIHRLISAVPFYADLKDKLSRFTNLEIKRKLQICKSELIFGMTELCSVLRRGNKKIVEKVVAPTWLALQEKCLAYNPVRVVIPASERNIAKSFGWLFRSVSKTLAKFVKGFGARGWEFLNGLVNFGKERFDDLDKAEIAFLQGLEDSLFAM